jgi:hypothetical protein
LPTGDRDKFKNIPASSRDFRLVGQHFPLAITLHLFTDFAIASAQEALRLVNIIKSCSRHPYFPGRGVVRPPNDLPLRQIVSTLSRKPSQVGGSLVFMDATLYVLLMTRPGDGSFLSNLLCKPSQVGGRSFCFGFASIQWIADW